MNKKDIGFITGLFDKLISAVNSLRPSFPKGGFVSKCEEKEYLHKIVIQGEKQKIEQPSPFCEQRGFAFHSEDKVITIRCCMKCGRELAELKLIEPGEFFTCETCKKLNSEYLQLLEVEHKRLSEKILGMVQDYTPNTEIQEMYIMRKKIMDAFGIPANCQSPLKWTDEDMVRFGSIYYNKEKDEKTT